MPRSCCPTPSHTSRRRRSSAPATRCGAGSAGRTRSRTNAWRWSASGGLGHLAVQYAKAAGFETIAVSHSPDKDGLVRELGADLVVRDGKGLAQAGGADVVLGTGNSVDAMAEAIAGLRPDGRFVLMGFEA